MDKKITTKRFNLVLPVKLADELQKVADDWGVSQTEVFKRFLRAGFFLWEAEKSPDMAILIREGDNTERLKFL